MLAQRLLLALVAVAALAPRAALADGAFRTVLVIDASSSMRRTDPNELRKVAAELFVDLARPGDELAVTGFDQAARQSTGGFITIDGPESRQRVKDAIRAIGNDGQWTNFSAGLREAKALLEAAPERPGDQELIVFLTDGRCEPAPGPEPGGDKERTAAERERVCKEEVLQAIAPELGGARVYAVGLSRGAPAPFLEELGRRTGGMGTVTLEPRELPELFATAYARLLGSRPGQGDVAGSATFEVYDSARTLDLVIVGRSERTGVVRDPGGAEVPIDNRDVQAVYFVASKEYRLYKIRDPKPGTWTVEEPGPGKRRFVTLQHLDLVLSLADLPRAVEKGQKVTLRGRLASPSGTAAPVELIARHTMRALVRPKGSPLRDARVVPLTLAGDAFTAELVPDELGELVIGLALEPGPDGMLSRSSPEVATLAVVPPVRLAGAVTGTGAIKQGQSGHRQLSLEGSAVGVRLELTLELGVVSDKAGGSAARGITLSPARTTLTPDGERIVDLTLAVKGGALAGERSLELRITPVAPAGFGDRAITVPVTVEVVALSFWERYGRLIVRGSIAALALFVLLGVVLPARFPRRALLYYADVRDLELPRRSSYPLGSKAGRGFYRAASVAIGPTGPVKKGGVVQLTARSGGAIEVTPLAAGATVVRAPVPADDEELVRAARDEERPAVPLTDGCFRAAAGVAYEIKGTGLVFWYK